MGDICLCIGIPDENKVEIIKKSLNYALRNHDRKELEEKMKTYKKLEQIEEIYGEKVYS